MKKIPVLLKIIGFGLGFLLLLGGIDRISQAMSGGSAAAEVPKKEEVVVPTPSYSDGPKREEAQLDLHAADYTIMYYMKTHLADPGSYSSKDNTCYPKVWYNERKCWVVLHRFSYRNTMGGMEIAQAKFYMDDAAQVVGAEL